MSNFQNKSQWAARRHRLRTKMAGILAKLDQGEVTEVELAQLHNYVMTSLMLLSKVNEGTFNAAIKEAEIAAWVRGEMFDVVMDDEILR